jgi:hypothetical protein
MELLSGAALNLLGVVARATRDVDILAFATPATGDSRATLVAPPTPLSEPLAKARDLLALRPTDEEPDQAADGSRNKIKTKKDSQKSLTRW